jgi:hypothetical protein
MRPGNCQQIELYPLDQICACGTLLGALTSGASELSKARSRTSGELKQNAEHPPKTDPNIPNDRRNLVKHDHINRHERCNGGEECAGGAR